MSTLSSVGRRKVGKGLDDPCFVCGERRFTERAHFPRRKRRGEEGAETIPLCPTHHRLLEYGRLSRSDYEAIWRGRFLHQANTVEEFVQWAAANGYPYGLEDLVRKFWSHVVKD